jgi:ParB/RepB/Spo0J family partition protein
MQVEKVLLSNVIADEDFNCRGHINPTSVIELSKDIQQRGLIQPVSVVKLKEPRQGCEYKLIAGFRRFMAHRVAKIEAIDAVIRPEMGEVEERFFNLSENIQRTDLNIMQEARALRGLKDLGVTEVRAAEKLGKSRGWIQIRYLILKLPEEVHQEIEAGMIGQSEIRDLYTIYKRTKDTTKDIKLARAEVFEAVKQLKDNKIKRKQGGRGKSLKVKSSKTSKRLRVRTEIFEMQEHIYPVVGAGLEVKLLAWCAGEITTHSLHIAIAERAVAMNLPYDIPK